MPIDEKKSGDDTPKYRKIFDDLRGNVLAGKYSDAHFPSEHALMLRYGVARGTVRSALRLLKDNGMLVTRKRCPSTLSRGAINMGERIGIVIPGISHEEIFAPICHELTQIAQAQGFTLILGDVSGATPAERAVQAKKLAMEYVRQRVAGVVYQPIELVAHPESANSRVLSAFDKAAIPVVLLDYDIVPPPERSNYDLVCIDNFTAGYRIGAHLAEMKAWNVRFLMRPNWAYSVRGRLNGVRAALLDAGCDVRNIASVGEPNDSAFVTRLLKARPAIEAIVCGNDTAAAQLIDTLRQLGRRVPEDLRVAGFDDVRVAQIVTPHLTTVRQPCREIARALFEMLIRRMRTPKAAARTIVLDAPLVVRESTSKRGDFKGSIK